MREDYSAIPESGARGKPDAFKLPKLGGCTEAKNTEVYEKPERLSAKAEAPKGVVRCSSKVKPPVSGQVRTGNQVLQSHTHSPKSGRFRRLCAGSAKLGNPQGGGSGADTRKRERGTLQGWRVIPPTCLEA